MCSICTVACISKCDCIRCSEASLTKFSSQCLVCGIEDGTCIGDCDAQIHFRDKKFCQLCASTKYTITFDKYIPNMHCNEHAQLHNINLNMKIKEIRCWGCLENQPNQMAHMDYGGCMEI